MTMRKYQNNVQRAEEGILHNIQFVLQTSLYEAKIMFQFTVNLTNNILIYMGEKEAIEVGKVKEKI